MNDETASELTPLKTGGGIPAILVRKVSDVQLFLVLDDVGYCTPNK